MKASGLANGALYFTAPNAFAAFEELRKKGYEPVAVAAGTDRIKDYKGILDKYFKTSDDKPIEHVGIELTRDEDAIETKKEVKGKAMDSAIATIKMKKEGDVDTSVISGSLARRAVELGYELEFAKIVGLEDKPALAKKMYDKIKASIGSGE